MRLHRFQPTTCLLLALATLPATAQPPSAERVARDYLIAAGQPADKVETRLDAVKRQSRFNDELIADVVVLRPDFVADGPQAALYMAIVQHHGGERPWCIRTKGNVQGATVANVQVSPITYLLPPGGYSVLMMALVGRDGDGQYPYRENLSTTYWRPDLSAPEAERCARTEPALLQAWLADPGYRSYPDFVQSRALTQDDLDATRLSDEDLQGVFDLAPVDDE